MIICIVSEIIDALGPSVQVVERSTVVLRYSSRKANYRGLIGPVCWAATGKLVSSLVAYIGKGCGECRSNLPLHCDVPLVHGRQPVVEGPRAREDVVGYKRTAINSDALWFIGSKNTTDDTARVGDRVTVAGGQRAPELGCGIECWRTLSEIEHKSAGVGIELLSSEDRQILRDCVAEDRAKHTDVIASPVAEPDHSFGIRLIRNPKPGSEMLEARARVPSQIYTVLARNAHFAGGQVNPAASARSGCRFRPVDFPPQPKIDG